jgi:hypothetical protein
MQHQGRAVLRSLDLTTDRKPGSTSSRLSWRQAAQKRGGLGGMTFKDDVELASRNRHPHPTLRTVVAESAFMSLTCSCGHTKAAQRRWHGLGSRWSTHVISFLLFCFFVRPGIEACENLDVLWPHVEIVPTVCSFWRQAGIVRPKGATVESSSDISWDRDCGLPVGHKEIRFSSGDGRMRVEDSLESEAEPKAVSDLGSQTKLTLRTCSGIESTAIESIFRTWTDSKGKVHQTTSLEYSLREEKQESWWIVATRFPVSSYQFDFFLTSNGKDFGDRIARVEIPLDLIQPASKSAAAKNPAYSGNLCIPRTDGASGYAPKWQIEFFTSDQAVRRAVLGAVVLKAVRDDRRSSTSGEFVDNECRSTYLANSIGIPLCLMALAGVAGLLLGTNIVSTLISAFQAWRNRVDDDPDPEDAITGSAGAADLAGPSPRVRDLTAERAGARKVAEAWPARADKAQGMGGGLRVEVGAREEGVELDDEGVQSTSPSKESRNPKILQLLDVESSESGNTALTLGWGAGGGERQKRLRRGGRLC